MRNSYKDAVAGEVTFGPHVCKGNYLSQWIAAGGYDYTAEAVFRRMTNFDLFLCGFSSVLVDANLTNTDVRERKLELVADTAREIW